MKILLIGSGGREHALAWKLVQSPLLSELIMAPGSDAMSRLGRCMDVAADDVDGMTRLALNETVDLVVVGPEVPLALGLADLLFNSGVAVFGPSQAAARLESSKAFTKDFCVRHSIPAAHSSTVTNVEEAFSVLARMSAPYVLKADGLAAGKGVVIANELAEAQATAQEMLAGQFGDASQKLVIEEFLTGEEASLFVLCDGQTAIALAGAQDHKRAFDGDTGPNTGGMGSYSPAPILDDAMTERVMAEIVRPTLHGMAAEGAPFTGILYVGLMIGAEGPKLIEYNVRFGDPECQVLMRRLESDLLPLLMAAATGDLAEVAPPIWSDDAAICVVHAAKGYPDNYEKGTPIRGLAMAASHAGIEVFHAGTKKGEAGVWHANGGRVLNITALAENLREAQAHAYTAITSIDWAEGFYRTDIGWRALNRG